MTNFDDMYCAHMEQLGLRYPDAYHIQRAWGVGTHRIESKVFLGGDIEVFISVVTPDGTVKHFAEPYTNSPRERAMTYK